MDWFPYPIKNIEGDFEYTHRSSDFVQNQVHPSIDIKSFRGSHDNTQVQLKGAIDWVEVQGAEDWRVHFSTMHVDDLIPDRMFRLALPPDLRKVAEELNPQGNPVSFSGTFEMRGSTDPSLPVTAGWNMETVLSGTNVWAGVDLEHVRGSVTSRGIYDGQNVEMTGELDIESADLWGDYQLTDIQGPYFLVDRYLWVGSVPQPQRPVSFQIDRNRIRPVTAKAIGGTISLEGNSLIEQETIYKFKIIMENGLLEEFARLYLPGTHNIKGVINSWMELQGQGNSPEKIMGKGQLLISPAALYELPVFVQMFNELGGLIPQDKTAFKTAFAEFDISQKQFRFNSIRLQGDSIGMYGQGTARFDGQLNLDFYSVVPRNNVPIPIVNEVVNEVVSMASRDMVGMKVRGNINRPVVTFDNAIKRLFDSIPVRDAIRSPAMLVPPFSFPNQQFSPPAGTGRPGN
ncbi:MAG: AsmA-like C-terminal region-containing protein [Planctomycetaceae bacterium]